MVNNRTEIGKVNSIYEIINFIKGNTNKLEDVINAIKVNNNITIEKVQSITYLHFNNSKIIIGYNTVNKACYVL